ncbi:hypothetical protein, partial [Pseudoduganella rivuli]|uniref:hypothetical protein n=1 Tax=Pseudoduganella rivuli TaxID=2666085 RepID=UPI003530D85A
PATARAASAAAALLAGAAASAPERTPVRAVAPEDTLGTVPAAMPAERLASGSQALHAAAVEAEVMARRANGEGEDAVYRTRAAQLPAAELAQLMAAEAAEADWRRKLAATPSSCTADCEAAPEHVTASAYRRDATPRLTLE